MYLKAVINFPKSENMKWNNYVSIFIILFCSISSIMNEVTRMKITLFITNKRNWEGSSSCYQDIAMFKEQWYIAFPSLFLDLFQDCREEWIDSLISCSKVKYKLREITFMMKIFSAVSNSTLPHKNSNLFIACSDCTKEIFKWSCCRWVSIKKFLNWLDSQIFSGY